MKTDKIQASLAFYDTFILRESLDICYLCSLLSEMYFKLVFASILIQEQPRRLRSPTSSPPEMSGKIMAGLEVLKVLQEAYLKLELFFLTAVVSKTYHPPPNP